MRILITLVILFFQFAVCQSINSQILNGSFESWTSQEGVLLLDKWGIEGDCWGKQNEILNDTDSKEGAFSLKLTGNCFGFEYDLISVEVAQEIQLNSNMIIPESFSFYYKIKNLDLVDNNPGCAVVVITFMDDLQNSKSIYWGGAVYDEILEWTKVEMLMPETEFIPTKFKIRIIGGGCNEAGNSSNLEFLIDDLQSEITVSTDDFEIDEIRIFPNPYSTFVNIKDAKNNLLELYSIEGKLLLQKKIDNDFLKLNLDGFSGNLFIVSISDLKGNIISSERLLKVR